MFKLQTYFIVGCGLLLFHQTGISQETASENLSQNRENPPAATVEREFYAVPSGSGSKTFQEAVTEHIVRNRGIQNFYTVPAEETEWLKNITATEKGWHTKLQQLEQDYRSAFQKRSDKKTGQNDRTILIQNYSGAINKLEAKIDAVRRQIVQLNVDQQVYINDLRGTPMTSLVAIKTLYTEDLMSSSKKLDVLNNVIFQQLKEPVLNHITATYGNSLNIPFQGGSLQVTYMYPENITLFDAQADEHVYLFLRVEAYPFSADITEAGNMEKREVGVQILSDTNQIQSYLKTEQVGDKRLMDWLQKELDYQQLSNDHILSSIAAKLSDYAMFRDGLKQNIADISEKVSTLEAKRDALIGNGEIEQIEADYKRIQDLYREQYANRVVFSHEKYTLENDVMFSQLLIEGESGKKNNNAKQPQMMDSKIAANIPISGRPLKDIFTDILKKANQSNSLNLHSYLERVYRPNEEQTQLIQGELRWEIAKEEFSIIKLARGNVGSRSHFVVHLAKRTHLRSKPSFPSAKTGVCKFIIYFERGKSTLRRAGKRALEKKAKCLLKFPQQIIQITGHTDPLKPDYGEGTKFSNVKLAMNRAETVMDYLVAQGFNPGRFVVISMGAKKPVAIGRKKKDLEKNRRVNVLSQPKF